MSKRDAVLDSSFWINCHRSGIVDFLPAYFRLFAPTAVVEELERPSSRTGLLTAAGLSFNQWRLESRITVQDPQQPVDWHGVGENAAVGLALERGYWLLLDDQAPYHYCRSQGLHVLASTEFTLLLNSQGRLTYTAAMGALKQLQVHRKSVRDAQVALEVLARQRGGDT